MSAHGDKFKFHEFKQAYNFLNSENFTKIYDIFNDEKYKDTTGEEKCKIIKKELSVPNDDEELILKFCNNLYKIIADYNNWNNVYFEQISQDNKNYCIHLKYWLYEETGNHDMMGFDISEDFQKWKDKLEEELNNNKKYPCTFNKLSWTERDKMRNIYAFVLIYYRNVKKFHQNKYIICKYLDYMGKGLKEYYDSLIKCSKKVGQDNYCEEFNEFQKTYMGDNIQVSTSEDNLDYKFEDTETVNCPLEIESLEYPLHLIYKKGKSRWHLNYQTIGSLNSSIISASSAIGTTVGISAFLLFLYKHTSFGSLFRTRMQKDNMILDDINEGTQSLILPTSYYESLPFENSDYNVTYYSLNNS
ncbi:PIR Superfamily Protein [Plasmodium ovale wallikeri]|uniref:PIR Superfamily Protein n=1 Tax=Plasmodium ovale wallikeri TaxID=864142 RepID=A0A1A9AK72_PLAOA|nr:PIR Superfamily Protein [Plasmodium ovale wallikeri]SBT56587.1 PIR Superfamily Protein [Plasmodium ovale wallikeri]